MPKYKYVDGVKYRVVPNSQLGTNLVPEEGGGGGSLPSVEHAYVHATQNNNSSHDIYMVFPSVALSLDYNQFIAGGGVRNARAGATGSSADVSVDYLHGLSCEIDVHVHTVDVNDSITVTAVATDCDVNVSGYGGSWDITITNITGNNASVVLTITDAS